MGRMQKLSAVQGASRVIVVRSAKAIGGTEEGDGTSQNIVENTKCSCGSVKQRIIAAFLLQTHVSS